jgi:hypothetical protein
MDVTSGLILGIVYVAAPGPINVETIRQGVKGGFIASLAVQTGPAGPVWRRDAVTRADVAACRRRVRYGRALLSGHYHYSRRL